MKAHVGYMSIYNCVAAWLWRTLLPAASAREIGLMQSYPSVCFHSNYWTKWPSTVTFCLCMGHAIQPSWDWKSRSRVNAVGLTSIIILFGWFYLISLHFYLEFAFRSFVLSLSGGGPRLGTVDPLRQGRMIPGPGGDNTPVPRLISGDTGRIFAIF